jgi:hypothetical protein
VEQQIKRFNFLTSRKKMHRNAAHGDRRSLRTSAIFLFDAVKMQKLLQHVFRRSWRILLPFPAVIWPLSAKAVFFCEQSLAENVAKACCHANQITWLYLDTNQNYETLEIQPYLHSKALLAHFQNADSVWLYWD